MESSQVEPGGYTLSHNEHKKIIEIAVKETNKNSGDSWHWIKFN